MKRNRWIAILLSCVLLAALTACGGSQSANADLLSQIKSRGSIVIATEGDWAPWTYHDEADHLAGFDVELGQLIAEELGVTAEFQETDWDAILAGVDSGRFDIACNGVGNTSERAEKYNFSTPYVYPRKVLVVRKDDDTIHTIADLSGKRTANSPNSTYAQIAEEAGADVIYVNTLAETMQALEQGRVDATLNAKESVEDYLREHPDANIKIVYEEMGAPVCIPTRKDAASESLLTEINKILDEAQRGGRLSALSEKYFGIDLTQKD